MGPVTPPALQSKAAPSGAAGTSKDTPEFGSLSQAADPRGILRKPKEAITAFWTPGWVTPVTLHTYIGATRVLHSAPVCLRNEKTKDRSLHRVLPLFSKLTVVPLCKLLR